MTAAYRHGARHLFHPAALAAQALLAVAGVAAVIAALTSRQHFLLRVHPAQIPVVIALSLAAVAVHELAHALVVIRHHRTVDAAGIRLHLGTPAFYVESASAVLLTRRARLAQAAAGVWAEWQFTSLIAILLWLCPPPASAPLLHRFVLLNAATIATNLLPFTGLDGSWLLADVTGIPGLTHRARGALTRLLTALATRQPIPAEDKALAAYTAANSLAATALLATAAFFWYQLFGGLTTTLTHHGPAGWAALTIAAIILGRPAATAAAARLAAAAHTARTCTTPSPSAPNGAGASPPPPSSPPPTPNSPTSPPPSSASSPGSCTAPATPYPPPSPTVTASSVPGRSQPPPRPVNPPPSPPNKHGAPATGSTTPPAAPP